MIFTKKLINSLNFAWCIMPKSDYSKVGQYGKAISNHPKGKRILEWNHDYYGKGIPHLTVSEDGGTRKVFHGKIHNLEELEIILTLVH